ncbi:hypothetical protein AVEN_183453-1 [Araneus ventricosus]|uniref:Uncharacterized protein n=1 Tax=Araneus ventricosus TaxID=182803 RepID=A0A4Y2EDA4_ARAVE|nr:hypothetical protein AVEN_183453-1 [Araneus ventricosus]
MAWWPAPNFFQCGGVHLCTAACIGFAPSACICWWYVLAAIQHCAFSIVGDCSMIAIASLYLSSSSVACMPSSEAGSILFRRFLTRLAIFLTSSFL